MKQVLKYQMRRKGKGKPWEDLTSAEFKKRMKGNYTDSRLVKRFEEGKNEYIYTVSAIYRLKPKE